MASYNGFVEERLRTAEVYAVGWHLPGEQAVINVPLPEGGVFRFAVLECSPDCFELRYRLGSECPNPAMNLRTKTTTGGKVYER